MNILQEIFTDYYEKMLYILHPRQIVIDNVDKMLNCGNPSFGGSMYAYPQCGYMKFVPFRCKSRFCPTCGIKYSLEHSTSMSFKLIHCTHRHCVFTIDKELRPFFLQNRRLLNCLFLAVRSVVLRMFHNIDRGYLNNCSRKNNLTLIFNLQEFRQFIQKYKDMANAEIIYQVLGHEPLVPATMPMP